MTTWEDLIRAERTAGGPAVSQVRQGADSAGCGKNPAEPAPTNAIPSDSSTRTTRVVGFGKLKKLLQPVHKWFADKRAWVKSFSVYQDKNVDLAYPQVKAEHKDNPYRRYKLSHKASSKTYKRIRSMVETRNLDDFAVASLVVTMPKFMSEYLASQGENGRAMAWRLFDGWWTEDLPAVVGQEIELASHTNLHLWRTEEPIKPHYHFHILIPSYGLTKADYLDEDGNDAYELTRWNWHRQRGGRQVPFSEDQMEELKTLWKARLNRFCTRHGLRFIETPINIWVSYFDTWQMLLHRLNYNGRHWSENYAEYSQDVPNCPDPPDWLVSYENRARCKGWWSNLKGIAPEVAKEEKPSPYTGEGMTYVDNKSLDGLLDYADGQLGAVEFVRGKPIESILQEEDISWLKEVSFRTYEEDLVVE